MTLRLWIGPAGSGKTFRSLSALRACERAGRAALLLVPEQFTYAADRLLLEDPELPGTRFVRVMSFRRFGHLAAARALLPPELTDEGRRLLLRRVVHQIGPEALGPLAPVRHTPGFVDALARAVREAKGIAGAEAGPRLAAAAGKDRKAAAVARVIAAYDVALQQAGMCDPSEAVHGIAAALRRDPGPWAGQPVWIDGFMSFTPEERVLLLALARVAGELTITLCADPDDAQLASARAAEAATHGISPASAEFIAALRPALQRPAFLPTLRTLLWLEASVDGPRRIDPFPEAGASPARFGGSADLARLERDLFRIPPAGPRAPGEAPSDVRLLRFPTPYHEVVGWARWIDRRTRLSRSPCRFRDITVLVRDLELYRPLIPEVFARYGIPVFIDQRRDATAHPLVRLCLSALRLAQGWSRDAVIGLLRNPLLALPPDGIDCVENLSLEYGIEHERWHETDWSLPPLPPRELPGESPASPADAGEAPEENEAPEEEDDLPVAPEIAEGPRRDPRREARTRAAIEARAIATRFFPALRRFSDVWRGDGPTYAVAVDALLRLLRDLAEASGAGGAAPSSELATWASSLPPEVPGAWPSSESRQVAQRLDETLRVGLALMPEVPIGAALLTRLLKDALGQAAIGSTPQSLDAVTVAEPRRARVNEADAVILGGLVAGAFPRPQDPDPLFSDVERERLAAAGFPLAAQAAVQAETEPYLLYVAVTRARRVLLLTQPALDARGGSAEGSSYLVEIARALGVPPSALSASPIGPGDALEACQHACELGAAAAARLREMEPVAAHHLLALVGQAIPSAAETLSRASARADRLRAPLSPILPPEIVAALHPDRTLITSASGLVDFAQCPFRYFTRHVLRLEPRPEPVLTPLSTGTAIHAALERFFSAAHLPSPEEAAGRMRQIFAELVTQEEFRVFRQDPPSSHRWDVTARNLARFAEIERRRLDETDFRPVAVELGFASAGDPDAVARTRQALLEGRPLGRIALPALEIGLEPGPDAPDGARWTIRVRGRIDRLDMSTCDAEDPTRRLGLVIDYKRRGPKGRLRTMLQRGGDLQIATYLLVLRDLLGIQPAGGIYYTVSPRPHGPEEAVPPSNRLRFVMKGYVTPAARDAIDPEHAFDLKPDVAGDDLGPILDEARDRIRALAAGIVRGEIRPDPRAVSGRAPCRMCDARGVCRFDDARHAGRDAR